MVIMRHSIIGFDINGLLIVGNGLIDPSKFLQNKTLVAVHLGEIRLDVDSLVVVGERVIQPPKFL